MHRGDFKVSYLVLGGQNHLTYAESGFLGYHLGQPSRAGAPLRTVFKWIKNFLNIPLVIPISVVSWKSFIPP